MIDLQRYRKENKIDQKEISKLTGLDQAIISKYENKKHVTRHVTEVLLEKIPELESYMISDSYMVSEPQAEYGLNKEEILQQAILNLTESNKILAESNKLMAKTQAELLEWQHAIMTKLSKKTLEPV
jgi:transcriptional regulator with XRE-family HTH domain